MAVRRRARVEAHDHRARLGGAPGRDERVGEADEQPDRPSARALDVRHRVVGAVSQRVGVDDQQGLPSADPSLGEASIPLFGVFATKVRAEAARGNAAARTEGALMFKVGEIVVYPRQGAGEVVARERKHILGEDHEYLTIRIFQSELTMLVRCDGVEAAGIRPVVAKQALQEIIDVLTGDVSEQDANWNRRFRAHQEQLKSSDPRELAGVIRNLARRQDEKGLSGGERQLLLRAKRLLASELQYARKTDEEEALAWIDDVLSPDARAA